MDVAVITPDVGDQIDAAGVSTTGFGVPKLVGEDSGKWHLRS